MSPKVGVESGSGELLRVDEAPALRSPDCKPDNGATSNLALDLRGILGDDMSFQLGSGESVVFPGSAIFE